MSLTYTARITFQDSNQPAVNRDCTSHAEATTALAELLRQFASVRMGVIVEPDGTKACFRHDGSYLFSIPGDIIKSPNREYRIKA